MKKQKTMETLKDGGYFRMQLERNYMGVEKFVYRLLNKDRQVVKGIGYQTYLDFEKEGLLKRKSCVVTSVWPQEWELSI